MGFFSAIFGKTDNGALTEAVNSGAFLVDVRTPAEFSAGSVKGAVNIPLDKVQSQLTKFKNKKSIVVFAVAETAVVRQKAFWSRMVFKMSSMAVLGKM